MYSSDPYGAGIMYVPKLKYYSTGSDSDIRSAHALYRVCSRMVSDACVPYAYLLAFDQVTVYLW